MIRDPGKLLGRMSIGHLGIEDTDALILRRGLSVARPRLLRILGASVISALARGLL